LEYVVTRLDKYFAAEDVYDYSTESYLQASSNILIEERGEISFAELIRLKVDLPRTQSRLKLLVETDPRELQSLEGTRTDTSLVDSVEEKNFYGSIQREMKLAGWEVRPSVGVKGGLPLDPFARIRFSEKTPINSWWFRFDENLYWFDSLGAGSDTTLEFDHQIEDNVVFRATSFARWIKENEAVEVSQVFSLFHSLDARRKLSYQIGAYADNVLGLHVTRYTALVRLREKLYQDWMFFEVRPQVDFYKIDYWKSQFSLLLNFEMLFGKKYLG
jgi:hypothetical protein